MESVEQQNISSEPTDSSVASVGTDSNGTQAHNVPEQPSTYPAYIQQDAAAVALPANMTEAGAAARANFAKMFLEEGGEDVSEDPLAVLVDEHSQPSATEPVGEQAQPADVTPGGTVRKRKSRWGVLKADETKDGEATTDDPNAKPKRKSRFQLNPAESQVAVIDPRSQWQQEMITVQARLRELQAIAVNPTAYRGKGFEGPSPDPIYDSNGKRTNTREARVREAIKKEQQELVGKAIELQGKITGIPVLPSSIRTRKEVRIPIPFDTYPDYNFKGVLIGARGLNQKRLEKETNCMIAVRGKGMRKKIEGVDSPEDNMDVHVLVAAYDQADLDKGCARVKELLVPVSPEERQKQLRELDVMNGTVRPEQMCHGCGESGHKLYNCPKKFEARSWKPANIVCSICGDVTHAYIDCPSNQPGATHSFAQKLNSEYDNFMAELTGEKPPEKPEGEAGANGAPGQLRPLFQNPLMPRIAPLNPVMARFGPNNPMGNPSLMGPRPGMPMPGNFNPLVQGNPFLGKFNGNVRPDGTRTSLLGDGPRPNMMGQPGQPGGSPGQVLRPGMPMGQPGMMGMQMAPQMMRPGMGMPPTMGAPPTGLLGAPKAQSSPSTFPPLLPSFPNPSGPPTFPATMPGPGLLPPLQRMDPSGSIPPWLMSQNVQGGLPMPSMPNPYMSMNNPQNPPWGANPTMPPFGMPPTMQPPTTPYFNNPYANIPQPTPTAPPTGPF